MSSEFDLIRKHFTLPTRHTQLGVGDDGALIAPRPGMELVVTTDMLVEGVHFFPDVDPQDLGWKTLAVNVSDIAAMGAEPRWAFLAIALPEPNEQWVSLLSQGFHQCARRFGVDLAGGDTTRGPLTLSVTLIGETPTGKAVRRDGARPDDDIWVTGYPGRAALGLAQLREARRNARPGFDVPSDVSRTSSLSGLSDRREPSGKARTDSFVFEAHGGSMQRKTGRIGAASVSSSPNGAADQSQAQQVASNDCVMALLRPMPRVEAGLALRDLATAMLDVSDGLLGDLTHILERSGCGADIETERLPMASLMTSGATFDQARNALLSGGDDYELLFTAHCDQRQNIEALAMALALPMSRIGRITNAPGKLRLIEANCERAVPATLGYDHFQT